jgi:hypothetical protein
MRYKRIDPSARIADCKNAHRVTLTGILGPSVFFQKNSPPAIAGPLWIKLVTFGGIDFEVACGEFGLFLAG